ncbi:MAG: GNAT family N-acetyltransferase [Sinomicrobium sp.]|nr:GNAT family N-acetyltransferase [Sinomicrobium sp.]
MKDKKNKTIHQLSEVNYDEISALFKTVYGNIFTVAVWGREDLHLLSKIFPKGQAAVRVDGQLAGCVLSLILSSDFIRPSYTYGDVVADYTFSTHTNKGDILYGIEVCVSPEFRGMGLGRMLYNYRKALCRELNLKKIMFAGRIPNYHKYSKKLTAVQYIEKVKQKELFDPVLNFQLANGYIIKDIIPDYLKDKQSENHAVLMEWINPDYKEG